MDKKRMQVIKRIKAMFGVDKTFLRRIEDCENAHKKLLEEVK